jgi:hypothetical protein
MRKALFENFLVRTLFKAGEIFSYMFWSITKTTPNSLELIEGFWWFSGNLKCLSREGFVDRILVDLR